MQVTYHEPGCQIPCVKYERSMLPVKDHHTSGRSLALKATVKRAHKSLFVSLERCLKTFLLRISG